MPTFSSKSLDRLYTCHPDLKRLFLEVIKHYDCTIIQGHRSREEQEELVRTGKSKTMNSKHLYEPSLAVDVVPYPVDWNDLNRFYYFGGLVKGMAAQLGIEIRWGGDWDGDNSFKDQTFHDLPHFELKV